MREDEYVIGSGATELEAARQLDERYLTIMPRRKSQSAIHYD